MSIVNVKQISFSYLVLIELQQYWYKASLTNESFRLPYKLWIIQWTMQDLRPSMSMSSQLQNPYQTVIVIGSSCAKSTSTNTKTYELECMI